MANFAFESDMQRIRQAEDTGKVSHYAIARDKVHAYAKHRQLDGRTGRDFAHGLTEHIKEFDAIIASYQPKR